MTTWKDDHVDLQYGGAKMPIVQDYHANHLIEAVKKQMLERDVDDVHASVKMTMTAILSTHVVGRCLR